MMLNRNIYFFFSNFFSAFRIAKYCVKTVIKLSPIEKKHQIEDLSPSLTGKNAARRGPVIKRIIDPIVKPIKAGATNMLRKWRLMPGNGYNGLSILKSHLT